MTSADDRLNKALTAAFRWDSERPNRTSRRVPATKKPVRRPAAPRKPAPVPKPVPVSVPKPVDRTAVMGRRVAAKTASQPQRGRASGEEKDSREWQLRDAAGLWIKMGDSATYTDKGQTKQGKMVGAKRSGMVMVELPDGKRVEVPAKRLTVSASKDGAKKTVAPAPVSQDRAAKAEGGKPLSPSAGKSAKARLPKGYTGGETKPATNENPDRKASSVGKGPAGGRATSTGGDKSDTRSDPPDDKRLSTVHSISTRIEDMLNAAAKKAGKPSPFAGKGTDGKGTDEKGKDGKGKDGKGKDEKGKDEKGKDEKGKDEKGKDEKGKDEKPRKDTRKKLDQTQIDQVTSIFRLVYADVKKGAYSGAKSKLERAKTILKDTSAPWLSKRIAYLLKGLGAL